MSKKEHRCRTCGVLLNVEECDDAVHMAVRVRKAQINEIRNMIIGRKLKTNSHEGRNMCDLILMDLNKILEIYGDDA